MSWSVESVGGVGPELFAHERVWPAMRQGGGQLQARIFYVDAPTVPAGVTLAAYRRARPSPVTYKPRPSVFRRARVLLGRRLAPVRALLAVAAQPPAAPDAAKAPVR